MPWLSKDEIQLKLWVRVPSIFLGVKTVINLLMNNLSFSDIFTKLLKTYLFS